jgi:hypothetical protein
MPHREGEQWRIGWVGEIRLGNCSGVGRRFHERATCRATAGAAQVTSSAACARFSAINMRGVLFHVSGPEESYQCGQIDGLDTRSNESTAGKLPCTRPSCPAEICRRVSNGETSSRRKPLVLR